MKKNIYAALLVFSTLFSFVLQAEYSESEWRIRPWEIIRGLKPHSQTLWQLDRDGLEGWSVKGADAELSTTDVTKLWGENVVKMTFPKGGSATVTLPTPLEIKEEVNGLDLWLYGPINKSVGARPDLSFLITDATGKKIKLPSVGSGSRWDLKRWWGMAAAVIPEGTKFPIQLHSFTFSKLLTNIKDDFLCFDMLGAWKFSGKYIAPDVSKMDLPFPTTPDTILPDSMADGARNFVVAKEGTWEFHYEGNDANIVYTYVPKTGNLSDITVQFNDVAPFCLAKDGGPQCILGGRRYFPDMKGLDAKLLNIGLDDGKLTAQWRWTTETGQTLDWEIGLSIRGKSLVLEPSSEDEQSIAAFEMGYVDGITKPQLFGMTYLNCRWDYPRLLATKDYILSIYSDWYNTNASAYWVGVSLGGLKVAEVLSDSSARVLGGTVYDPLTNGKRVPLKERFFITISKEITELLPNIPNPPSIYRDEMAKTVCLARAYSLQGYPTDVRDELAFWQNMKDYGAEDMFVRYHGAQFRTPLENNHTTLSLDGSMSNGGDPTMVALSTGMRKIVNRVGPYQDNRLIHANDPYFNYDILSRGSNGSFLEGWDGCFRPKPAAMLELYADFVPKFLAKYPYNALYLDELDNAPPWGDVDFDADQPGAGTYLNVFRAYGAVALQQKRLYGGPIWSEGCAAVFWAGLMDVDYGVSNDTAAKLPLMVDFKLRKINPLSTYTGADWPIDSDLNTDRLLSTEIATGNIGYLCAATAGPEQLPTAGRMANLKIQDYEKILKSYFMMRQLQENFYSSKIAEIKYFVDGELMTTSEMVMAGKISQGRIYLRYENGLEIWVNRTDEGPWEINVEGEDFTLPPYGHYAVKPYELLQYTIVKDDHTVDYSQGPLYTYVNGHSVTSEFPECTVSGAYLLRKRDDGVQLIPVPFLKKERVANLSCDKAIPLNQDGTPAGEAVPLDFTEGGAGALVSDGSAFSYLLQ